MNDIQGCVIVNKETGERFGGCYDSMSGAKTSFNSFTRRSASHYQEYRHLTGKKFNNQDEFVIKPLVIYVPE